MHILAELIVEAIELILTTARGKWLFAGFFVCIGLLVAYLYITGAIV